MTADLPDRWSDEPWPLDDPVPAAGLNPTNWSDTHDEPPQVADLADEAWEYAVDRGISLERALVELQDRAMLSASITDPAGNVFHSGGRIRVTYSFDPPPMPDAWPDPDQRWFGFADPDCEPFDLSAPAIGQDLSDFDPGDVA